MFNNFLFWIIRGYDHWQRSDFYSSNSFYGKSIPLLERVHGLKYFTLGYPSCSIEYFFLLEYASNYEFTFKEVHFKSCTTCMSNTINGIRTFSSMLEEINADKNKKSDDVSFIM